MGFFLTAIKAAQFKPASAGVAAWRQAADEGAVSPAVLEVILASLEQPEL